MAQPANAWETYDIRGQREDLAEAIYNIAPTETPFVSMVGVTKPKAVFHEWQLDSLAAADEANAVVEGDDATIDAAVATARVGNYTQISDKTVLVTGTAEETDKAGRRSEMAYQLAKKGKELKRDLEAAATRNVAGSAGAANGAGARRAASLEAWYTTSVKRGAGGASGALSAAPNGFPNAAATDGTQRALTEPLMKDAIQLAWTAGGDPTVLMAGPINKQNISAMTGMSTRTDRGEDKRVVAATDIYVSDFGEHRAVPNRFSRDRTLHILDPSLWAIGYLRPWRSWPLAKSGDHDKRQLLIEWTLVSKQEAGNAVVADLTT